MASERIISPLTEALYGTNFEIDGRRVPIRKNDVVCEDDNRTDAVIRRLLNRILMENKHRGEGQVFKHETKDDLYDTIKSNVMECKMFTSRHIGRCYITNKNYGENCDDVLVHAFPGAECALGARWFYSAFPHHTSAKWLLPFADLCFNYGEFIVPVCDFPNISQHSDGKNYIVVNVKRTSGAIQRGIIKVNEKSMVNYRFIENHVFIHPAHVPVGTKITPIVKTYFNYDGSDIDLETMNAGCPVVDCTKDIPIERLIESNPVLADAFRIGDEQIAGFQMAFEVSAMKIVDA